MGDNLHQRAVMRELMEKRTVFLESSWVAPYHDLIGDGLKVLRKETHLRTQAKNADRESDLFCKEPVPPGTPSIRLRYGPFDVRRFRSVLVAMFRSAGLAGTPDRWDFRLPVKPEWIAAARAVVGNPSKPILVYRPIVIRTEWNNEARNPCPIGYGELFTAFRDRYHVVSVADLEPGKEWITSAPIDTDQEFHRGELPFETLAGLFAIASLVWCSPGFSVVLAQAVGAPVVGIFGHYERAYSFSCGASFSPSCFIEPITPSDAFKHVTQFSRAIDVPRARKRISAFIDGGLHDFDSRSGQDRVALEGTH